MTLKEQIASVSIPKAEVMSDTDPRFQGGGHVSLVFSDGEHTTTKAGGLYGQRNFHCLSSGHATGKLEADWFPQRMGDHAFVFCTYEDAQALSRTIHMSLDSHPTSPSQE